MKLNSLPNLDPRLCDCRLIWANERVVEETFLEAELNAEEVSIAWLLRSGWVRVSDGDSELRLGRGEWLFPKKGVSKQQFRPGTRILSIRFQFRNRDGGELFGRNEHRLLRSAEQPALVRRARDLVREVGPWNRRGTLVVGREQIPLDANLGIEAAFFRWLAEYAGAMLRLGERLNTRGVEDARVRKALDWIARHPMSEPFRVTDLARDCGLGVNRLGALFHQATGRSPRAFYETRRLEEARHLLRDSGLSIKEIAWTLGFSSLQHFSNWFRARGGLSPREYAHGRGGGI